MLKVHLELRENMDIISYKKKIFEIKTEKEFNNLALTLFQYQYFYNPIYKQYIDLNNIQIGHIKTYHQIPCLPIELFRNKKIITKNKKSETIFISSGTTSNQKSKHYIGDLELYKRTILNGFNMFFGNPSDYVFFCLIPDFNKNPHSSLSFMCSELIAISKHRDSGFFLEKKEELINNIKQCQQKKIKFILFGLSFEVLDFAKKSNLTLEGGVVIQTGGTKKKHKHIIREELNEKLKSIFRVDTIYSEYGMAELLSQSYSKKDFFQPPPWKKILIRDKTNPMNIIGENKRGCINVIDLANIHSCGFIATNDLGQINTSGFDIIGRAQNATQKGCSLMT